MVIKDIFIKYLTNQPVGVKTRIFNTHTFEWVQTVFNVSDLVAAVKQALPSKLGAIDLDELTLHLPSGVDRSALQEDCFAATDSTGTTLDSGCLLSALGSFGSKSKEPLIIKSKNDMAVDSSPTTSDLSGSSINIRIDGIALGTEHLPRNELVRKLQSLVSSNSIVLLTSPAGSGKSSLYKLYKAATLNAKVVGIPFDERTAFEQLCDEGIDFKNRIISEKLDGKNVVVFLDDAQKKYSEVSFWEALVKATGIWIPENIKFIISATHSLSGGKESPVEFQSLPRLSRMDFLLTDEEAYRFLEFTDIGLPVNMRDHKILKDVLVKESGGLVGALRLSINSLTGEFHSYRNCGISESLCLQYCLSLPFVQNMARCFGSGHSYPAGEDFKNFLQKCFENEKIQLNILSNQQDEESYSSLKKAGILVELSDSTFSFSSQLAKRYYFKWIFPKRSDTAPESLIELVRNVISSMSATTLQNSTRLGDFPKEAVFQHLFMEGLASFTPPNCSICPELSKIFPGPSNSNTQQTIAGEIDFYLNSSLRWGIELLVKGGGIGEHISRFTPPNGKYVPLAVRDYAVVDFRRNSTGQPTSISRYPNRITVFFKDNDYSIAHCFFGVDTVEIRLSV